MYKNRYKKITINPLILAMLCWSTSGNAQKPDSNNAAAPSLPAAHQSFDDNNKLGADEENILNELQVCRNERVASSRVKCYDDLTDKKIAKINSATILDKKDNTPTGGWIQEKSTDGTIAIGVMSVFSELDSSSDNAGKNINTELFLRCRPDQLRPGQNGHFDIYIGFGKKLFDKGEPVDVSIKLGDDKKKQQTQAWEPSISGTALGLWGSDRSIPILHEIMHERHISTIVILPGDKNFFASFDLIGIQNALVPLTNKCAIF